MNGTVAALKLKLPATVQGPAQEQTNWCQGKRPCAKFIMSSGVIPILSLAMLPQMAILPGDIKNWPTGHFSWWVINGWQSLSVTKCTLCGKRPPMQMYKLILLQRKYWLPQSLVTLKVAQLAPRSRPKIQPQRVQTCHHKITLVTLGPQQSSTLFLLWQVIHTAVLLVSLQYSKNQMVETILFQRKIIISLSPPTS